MHQINIELDSNRIVLIKYTNHRGEFKPYRVIPHSIRFGRSPFHQGSEQWFLTATDVSRNVQRDFAMKDIASWSIDK